MRLTTEEISKVINCCNSGLITDRSFDPERTFPNEWFISLFDFIDDAKIREQLGEAFYQARFTYKLMQVLKLKNAKTKGIIKFQIIQYASICEGLLTMYLVNTCVKNLNGNMRQQNLQIVQMRSLERHK